MKVGNSIKLFITIAISEIFGFISGVFVFAPKPNWYSELIKSRLAPPNEIVSPVFTVLLAQGIAVFLVWQKGPHRRDVKMALGIFGVQLLLDISWTVVFFVLQNPFWAFINLAALGFILLIMFIVFFKISKLAGFLLAPYFAWICFASYLVYAMW